jgi:hypothetical protein
MAGETGDRHQRQQNTAQHRVTHKGARHQGIQAGNAGAKPGI